MSNGLRDIEIYGSNFFRLGKVQAIYYITLRRLIIPQEIMKKDSDEIMKWVNELTREEYLLLP